MMPTTGAVTTVSELLAAMDRSGLAKGLVWHVLQYDGDAALGNRRLADLIAGQPRLRGCWTLLPPQTGEVVRPGFFDAMRAANVTALRAFPGFHNYLLNRTTFGAFMDEVVQRRVPLLLSLARGVNWRDIDVLLGEFPGLTCILCDIGIWGCDRFYWPLLEKYPRVSVETSLVSLEAGGLEAGVRRFGASRYVFGSGFPLFYPEAPLLDLLHAELAAGDREDIAAGNLERLLSEVRL
jgi:hypothetical protein